MKLIQHVTPEPDWPEYGFTFEGERVRLVDVEATFPVGSDARAGVYYLHPTKPGVKVYPWKEAGYYVDDHEEPLVGAGPKPMPLAELVGLGLTDQVLFAEHAAYYPDPAVAPHHHADPDAPKTQVLRRRVYDEVMAAWYGEPPMRCLRP